MEKVEVNLMGAQPGHEIIIREGEALPVKEPLKLTLSGDIRSVSSFYRKRLTGCIEHQEVLYGASIVIADKDKGTITLETNPNDCYATTVTGRLEVSDELKKFRINEGKTLTQKEVIDILKFNKVHFREYDQQEKLLKAYQAFTYSANSQGKNEADTRGNRANAFTKNVETNLPDDFVLKIPVYKGEDVKEFRVEICLDITEGSARFWFESVELHEIMQIEKEIIFSRELEICKGLVVIYK